MSLFMDLLDKHARDNVWCTPTQDTQYMIKPSRITLPRGAQGSFTLMRQSYPLPASGLFHVYQFGQVPPSFFNIMEERAVWRKVSTVCNANKVIIDLYLDNGVQYPRYEAWFLILPDKNILIAVKDQTKIQFSLRTNSLSVRFYSNSFFSSERSTQPVPIRENPSASINVNYHVNIIGKTVATVDDIGTLATQFVTEYAKSGYAYGIVNGYRVNKINSLNIAIGDLVEIVHDSTIVYVIDIPMSEMGTFTSELDTKQKFLATYIRGLYSAQKHIISNNSYVPVDKIFFKDDIDFVLYKDMGSQLKKGVMYHRNNPDSVRMVTHKDYSLPVDYVNAYVTDSGLFSSLSDITLQLHIRLSGYDRELVDDINSIKELYKIVDPARSSDVYHETMPWVGAIEDLKNVMLGNESGVPEWTASHLEASAYPQLMRSYKEQINDTQIVNAYGFNSIEKNLFPSNAVVEIVPPEAVNSNDLGVTAIFPAPPLVWKSSTVRFYGNDSSVTDHWRGKLLGFFNAEYPTPPSVISRTNSVSNAHFWPVDARLAVPAKRPVFAKITQGTVGESAGIFLGVVNPLTVDLKGSGFVCIKCENTPSGPTNEWIDITDSSDYTVSYNSESEVVITFNVNQSIWYCGVVLNHKQSLDTWLSTYSGESLQIYTAHQKVNEWNVTTLVYEEKTIIAIFEPERLELYSNNHRMVEGLDYYVNWPQIGICSALPSYNDEILTSDITHQDRKFTTAAIQHYCIMSGVGQGDGLTRIKDQESGFIKSGIISANGSFDIRDTKDYSLYINGWYVGVDKLRELRPETFAEDGAAAWMFMPELSGKPYLFERQTVGLQQLPDGLSNRTLKREARERDARISDYLTLKYPLEENTIPHVAEEPYKLFSPFFSKILADMKRLIIPASDYSSGLTDGQLQTLLSEYEYILQYDPCRKNNEWWKDNVVILGHPFVEKVEITVQMRTLLTQINRVYLYNKIDITGCTIIQ